MLVHYAHLCQRCGPVLFLPNPPWFENLPKTSSKLVPACSLREPMHALDIRSRLLSSHYVDLYHLRSVYLALHVTGGIVGLPALVLTCIIARDSIPFQPDLINIYISGIVNSITYLLLVFASHWRTPPHTLCFVQAAMVLGAPPMIAISVVLVVIKMHLTFRKPINFLSQQGRLSQRPWALLFYSLPYIAFTLLLFTSVGIQLHNETSVSAKNGLYCTVYGSSFRRVIVPAITLLCLATMIVLEALILQRYMLSHRRIAESFPLAGARPVSRGIVIRVIIFNIYLGVVFGASAIFLAGCRTSWPYMTQAAVPLSILMVFGTQKSVLRIWFGWLSRSKKPPISVSEASVVTMVQSGVHKSVSDMNLPATPSTSASSVQV